MAKLSFDKLSAEEKRQVEKRVDTLVEPLKRWVQRYPCMRATRIPASAVLTSTALPRLSTTDALMITQMILWIFGVDDEIDERMITLGETLYRAEKLYSLARDGPSGDMDDGDQIAAILLEMRQVLVKSHLFESLHKYWAFNLRRLVETMSQEYRYGLQYNAHGVSVLPSVEEYLHYGKYSVGFPFWMSTVLILLRDSSVLDWFKVIDEAIGWGGAAIRLYNDIRTFEREIQERNINSVLILTHEVFRKNPDASQKEALSEAKRRVLRLADQCAERCRAIVARIETDSKQFEEVTVRVLAFNAHFYGNSQQEYDYHLVSLPEAYECLDTVYSNHTRRAARDSCQH